MTVGHFVADLSWPELESLISSGYTAVLPIGAHSKEHGLHLPLSTDAIQVEWLCRQLVKQYNLLVWPTVGYGFYPAFADFPGHSSLGEATFGKILEEITHSILGNGHRRCIILNSGISTIPTIENLVSGVSGLEAIHIYSGKNFQRASLKYCQQTRGGHADEVETSIMMFVAPDFVKLDLCVDESGSEFKPGPLNRFNPDADNYTASGAMGNPELASAYKGEQLANAMLDDIRDHLLA